MKVTDKNNALATQFVLPDGNGGLPVHTGLEL